MDGLVTAKEILGVVGKHTTLHGIKLLDWGCGPGRVARHIPDFLGQESEVYATDSNKKYITWCRNHLSGIRFSRNDIEPPMNFSSSIFDVVLGLSIFTHLSEHRHSAWLDELHRVVKPGGIVLLTTQGDFFRRKLLPEEHAQFESGQFVARRYVVEGHRLFSSFQPRKFMLSLVEKKFNVIECIEGSNDQDALMEQDIWVLEKR
jgi:ubiquinone/menaquinone biosynthesis C-methylase UbiE